MGATEAARIDVNRVGIGLRQRISMAAREDLKRQMNAARYGIQ
jgi:hypothetical protein